jgi:hypothetical protein
MRGPNAVLLLPILPVLNTGRESKFVIKLCTTCTRTGTGVEYWSRLVQFSPSFGNTDTNRIHNLASWAGTQTAAAKEAST